MENSSREGYSPRYSDMLKYLGFLLLLVVIISGGYYFAMYMQDARNEPRSADAHAKILAFLEENLK